MAFVVVSLLKDEPNKFVVDGVAIIEAEELILIAEFVVELVRPAEKSGVKDEGLVETGVKIIGAFAFRFVRVFVVVLIAVVVAVCGDVGPVAGVAKIGDKPWPMVVFGFVVAARLVKPVLIDARLGTVLAVPVVAGFALSGYFSSISLNCLI